MESNDGLNTILSSFEPVETKVWLEQITRDLRGKTIEDVLWEYDDDVSISPFAGSNAGVHQGSEIDFNADWEIAEEFQVSEETRANDQILISLRGGCETLILKVSSVPDWATLFRDVNLDMIRTYIAPPREIQEAIVSSLNSWLASVNVSSDAIAVRSDNIAHMGAAHEASKQTVVDQIVNTISSGLDLIDVTAPDDTIECIAEIGPYFYIEVARLRALRILWRNVLEALDRKGPQLLIETHMAEKFLSDDRHLNMISAGTKAIAAICGGADRIVINPSRQHDEHLSRRISRNVHHILKYESNLHSIPDPVKGSFYFESLLEQIVKGAWGKLTEE